MNVFWTNILMYIGQIFAGTILQMTPAIKSELNELLTNMFRKALKTPNPWDDFAVGLLLDILAIPRPPPE